MLTPYSRKVCNPHFRRFVRNAIHKLSLTTGEVRDQHRTPPVRKETLLPRPLLGIHAVCTKPTFWRATSSAADDLDDSIFAHSHAVPLPTRGPTAGGTFHRCRIGHKIAPKNFELFVVVAAVAYFKISDTETRAAPRPPTAWNAARKSAVLPNLQTPTLLLNL
ncbi:unnamed protein product [Bemisia tabaci]|uniref:Uncharacterized protein n=1 Tax=Bemisia tabaci TaxID=7038 RepID=A0A9P0F7A5_BEMTA|nr:unnamed protein product [Bemisia tabaci]